MPSSTELCRDLRRAADRMGLASVSPVEYIQGGGDYSIDLISRRLGGWDQATAQAGIPVTDAVIDDVIEVARAEDTHPMSLELRTYTEKGRFSEYQVHAWFGRWDDVKREAAVRAGEQSTDEPSVEPRHSVPDTDLPSFSESS